MRDDPIVYEDWDVGFSTYFKPQSTKYFDLILSFTIGMINITVGWYYQFSFLLFLWTFILIIVILFEGMFDQRNRSAWDRSIVFLAMVAIHFISSSQLELLSRFESAPLYHLVIGVLLALKLLLIPITESTLTLAENILVPRNTQVTDFLNEQVKRLQSTDYQLESQSEFDLSLKKLQKMILSPFAISLLVILFFNLLLLIPIDNINLLLFPIFIGIMLINGITLSAVLLVAYLEIRKTQKKEREIHEKEIEAQKKEEEIPAKQLLE
ncbi:MAG: hypothetical protein ACW99A_13230 [Candidatus Kariarchaeaceae archaeon]|jgi:hypothetical protein